jgi:hypothetical protein
MKKICEEYASEKDTDGADVKRQRFDRISDLMMKVLLLLILAMLSILFPAFTGF